jgi:fatty-acyl-CoA synthase
MAGGAPGDLSMWIERWADFQPDKPAVHFDDQVVTYAALAADIDRLAAVLSQDLGIGAGERVAHLGYNGPDLLVLLFACARLGAILVPLNWRLAEPEHHFMLADAGVAAAFVEPDFLGHAGRLRDAVPDCRFVAYGPAATGWLSHDDAMAASRGGAPRTGDHGSPLMLVYTSGTTGQPKGAVLAQKALFWNAVNAIHANDLINGDHVLTNIPMFHVGGMNIQTVPALHVGASLTLHRRFDPDLAFDDIARRRPTLTLLVPAMMQAMVRHPRWPEADLSSLRGIHTGSSPVPDALIQPFLDKGVPIGQIYGATETAPIAIYMRFHDGIAPKGSCGKPAIHCAVRVVDDAGRDLGPDERGEILVSGANLFSEYWGRAEDTAAVLRDGWFHTGDVGHRDENGFYYVDDRKKDVVISGGENIYPAELENVLADCPDILEAAVIGQPDERWGEIAVAMVVRRADATLDAAAVLALFEGRLARFKHPRRVMFVDALPRNAMGKVMKFQLRADFS